MIKITTLILITLFVVQVKAQNNTLFLKDYYKFNLELSGGYFYGAKTSKLPSTLSYSFKNYVAPRFGLHYDFLQKGNFNFKVGFSALILRDIDEIRLDEIEQAFDSDITIKTETFSGDWQFNIPITVEYIIPFNKSKLTFNASYIIGIQDFYYAETGYGIGSDATGGETTFEGVYWRGDNGFHPGAQLGVGMYFPFKKWMLRTNLYYNVMLEKMYKGTFEFRGLRQSPDINGTYSFSGNSFGIELSIYLAKKKKKM